MDPAQWPGVLSPPAVRDQRDMQGATQIWISLHTVGGAESNMGLTGPRFSKLLAEIVICLKSQVPIPGAADFRR